METGLSLTNLIIAAVAASALTGAAVWLISRRVFNANFDSLESQARSKARAIELEAEALLERQKAALNKKEQELQAQFEAAEKRKIREYEQRIAEVDRNEAKATERLRAKMDALEAQQQKLAEQEVRISQQKEAQERVLTQYKEARDEAISVLSNYSKFTKDEARAIILKRLEDELAQDKANLIRRYEAQARDEAKKRANYIIAQATTRFAGEFATERLINVVALPSDELKGRIIGKEGRNIKTLEMISGVDIIIDETPCSITLSSHNLYRRAIATKTLEALIEDGRIQPARIEEVYNRTKEAMEEQVLNDGESVVLDLGLGQMNPELKKLLGRMRYRASFGQNALAHSIEVAHLAGIIAGELDGDEKIARRAGLLHDIGKALTQESGGNHVDLGFEVCKRYKEHPIVLNAIMAHHGNEEVKSIECAAVCAADALSAARPGARREVLESFLRRMSDLERIATEKVGVKNAYAIDSGREVRVIVAADVVDDAASILMAREIAKEVESTLQYPGEIKVNVIRETRATEYAR